MVSASPEMPRSKAKFHLANWQTQDGLLSNKVMAVLQTRDGYLWAGTFEGLVRFDGIKFRRVENPNFLGQVDTSVTALFEAPDRTLWIGNASGGVSSYRDGVFTYFDLPREIEAARVQGIAADTSGDVWSLSVAGNLRRIRDGLMLHPEAGGARGVFEMTSSSSGVIWLSCRGKLSELKDGRLRVIPLLPSMDDKVLGICASADGGLWVTANGMLRKYVSGKWSDEIGAIATKESPIYTLTETRDGRLVAGTFDMGALIITPQPFQQQQLWRETGFPSDWVLAACEDQEGNLWIATGSAGLFRVNDEKVKMRLPPDQWQGRGVLSAMVSTNGDLWVGTEGAGLYRLQGEEWIRYSKESGLDNLYVWSVCEDSDGRLLVGTWGGGIYEKRGERFVRAPGIENIETGIAAMVSSRRGGVLVGSRLGAFRYAHDQAQWLEPGPERKLKDVRSLLEDPDGTIWVACNGDGLGQIANGSVRRFSREDGLSSNYIQCLYRSTDGALWIGTRGAGLNRLKNGRFSVITSAQGLIDDTICHIETDRQGHLWLGSHGGIMRIAEADLNACAEGDITRLNVLSYGLSDGLLTLACSGALQPAGFRLQTGALIFATGRGLAEVDPANMKLNREPPPVWIESVRVGDRTVFEGTSLPKVLEIGPGQHRVEIKYTGLSFAAPEKVHFKRYLEGLEPNLVEVGSERTTVYNYVPPGEYVFHVIAANNDNIWSQTGQQLRIVVRPYFWQTRWFEVLVVVLLIGIAAGFAAYQSRRRMQRKLERLERARAIELERTRIANDMHDDLGAQLTRITMLSDSARGEMDEPERLRQGLNQIYDTSRNVTRAMDEIVWAVNPKHDTLESLVCYLEKFAQDFLRAAGIRCRLDMPLDYADWTPSSDVRHNLFLCYKEALNNAVRHAHADTVTVSLQVTATECIIKVVDNGRGLGAAAHCGDGHLNAKRMVQGNGLENLRRRMVAIGGRCEISDMTGGGCSVILRLPVSIAGIESRVQNTESPS